MAEHITAGEFERWMNHLSEQNKQILAEQRKTNGRVTKLEVNQEAAGKLSAKLSTIVALIVTGIVQGGLAFIGGKH